MIGFDDSVLIPSDRVRLRFLIAAIDAERERYASIVEALILPVAYASDVNIILHAAARAIREGVELD